MAQDQVDLLKLGQLWFMKILTVLLENALSNAAAQEYGQVGKIPEKSAHPGLSWRCNCHLVWHTCATNINTKRQTIWDFWYQLLSSQFSLKQCAAETSTLKKGKHIFCLNNVVSEQKSPWVWSGWLRTWSRLPLRAAWKSDMSLRLIGQQLYKTTCADPSTF